MRYTQPQSGPFTPDLNSELLTGGSLLALMIGPDGNRNQADGKALVRSGAISKSITSRGIGILNTLGAGDLSANIAAVGGSIFVDFWHGYYYAGGSVPNQYLFGDYTGSAGTGLAGRHNDGLAGRWGYFDGTALADSGETLALGQLHTFVVVRDTAAGVAKVYRDGVLRISATANVPVLQAQFSVGSIGQNQFGSFGTESVTLLAGRIRFKSWNAAQVARFTANPWQLFRSPQRVYAATAGGGPATYSYTATGGFTLSGTTPNNRGVIKTPIGGLNLSGGALTNRGAIRTPSGGLSLSGTALTLRGRVLAGLGGMSFSGAASLVFTSAVQSLTVTPVGGLIIRGTATMVRSVVRAVSGGITFAGHAATTLTPDPNPPTAHAFKRGRRPRTRKNY